VIEATQVSGNLKLYLYPAAGTATAGTTTIVAGTWYRVGFVADQTAGQDKVIVYLNGSSEISIADYTDATALRRAYFGSLAGGNTAAAVVQFDNIAIDDDTIPAACN
jgi:hypothetical protein